MTARIGAGRCGDVQVVYEDNHVIVAVKPPNLLCQADATADVDMLTLLKGYIKDKYAKPGEVYLGLVHRLDRPAGGLMVFARTSKAAARLSAQFRSGDVQKDYWCVCAGQPQGRPLRHFLLKDAQTNRVAVVPEGTPGAREARLFYAPVEPQGDWCLCRVRLETGRPHQIRAQFAAMGHPLYGDARYNPASRAGEQLALWSCHLGFTHPVKKDTMEFDSNPQGGVWRHFAALN